MTTDIMDETPTVEFVSRPLPESDATCVVCGKPLAYSGRGRPPTKCDEHKNGARRTAGTKAGTPRESGSVERAVASLNAVYTLITTGLMAIGAREAASDFSKQINALNASNAEFLARDPELVKIILKGGAATGRVGFFATNAVVLIPLGAAAYAEVTNGRRNDVI